MRDIYLSRRDVLDRIHQNPNAAPVVYPDEFGAILMGADVTAIAGAAIARLGLASLPESALARLAALDKAALIDALKARRDLIGFLDAHDYDDGAEARAAWRVLWDGMSQWDNRAWNWPQIAAATAMVDLFCPPVEQHEAVVLAHGSTAH